MTKITLTIDSMMCIMCETRINEAIKKAFKKVKVSSSHQTKQTIILTKHQIDQKELKKIITDLDHNISNIKIEEE